MENAGVARALASTPIGALASRFALAAEYKAVARPSLPNYLAMTSGSTWDITDNSYHALPATGIGAQLTAAGIPWRAYTEGLTQGCFRSPYPYALKHNPFAYYGGVCPDNVVPLELLDGDLGGEMPRLAWITPGLCHDGHDCSLEEAGAWLASLVTRITASRAWADGGVLFVVWDEGDGGDENVVPLIVAAPHLSDRTIGGSFDHYSLLATIEDLFALPRLGNALGARAFTDLVR
jgi:phospholipase C